jgi:hypothetical protein
MPKFTALSIEDLFTAERDAGRVARKVEYIVACEASDGTWCEFDADTLLHASLLADNAVDKLGARGCSVWRVRLIDGKLVGTSGQLPGRLPLYKHFAA